MSRFLRRRDEEQHASNLELFYDLVFVLAVTQISHLLLGELNWHGAARSLLVLLVVWWAWNYTTWVTNSLDPDAIVVRLLVLAIMFGSLVMAVAIPGAFGSRALLFAGAYVAIQVGRHAFVTYVGTAGCFLGVGGGQVRGAVAGVPVVEPRRRCRVVHGAAPPRARDERLGRARACASNPDLVLLLRRVLACGWGRLRHSPDRALARGTWHRLLRAVRPLPRARAQEARPVRVGRRELAFR